MPESRDRLVRGSSITPIFSRRSERGYWIDTDQETGIGNGRRNLMGSPTQFGGSTVIIGRRGSLIRSPLGLYGSNRSVGGQENRSLVVNGRRGGGSRIRGRNSVLPSWYPRRPLQDITAISAKRKLSDMLGSQWSKDELERFYEAYRKYGKDWKKVASVVRNRTIEMVEALYNMNRAYLSLPEGTASVAGLIAMMTDHYNIMVFGALIIAKLLSVPLVMSYHTHVPIYLPSYSFSWMVKPMWMIIKFLHRAADLTLVPSAAIGRDLEAARVTEANKIRLWSKGVDSEKFHPRFRNKEMRIRLCNGEPEKPLLIHVGRLGAEKSLDFLKTSTLMLDNLYFSECWIICIFQLNGG